MKKDIQESLGSLQNALDRLRKTQPQVESDPEKLVQAASAPSDNYLIAGLGNPGKKYANNRHNAGFMVIDRLADRLGLSFSRVQQRALVTDGRFQDHKLILVKPQTYMNESGGSIGPLVKFYKIPLENLLIIFDEMDLPLGTLRIRPKGGSSGQQGMQSIIRGLGNQKGFPRMRVGIGRPPGRTPPPAYLLQDFSYDQQQALDEVLDQAVDAVLVYVTEGLSTAMNQFNGIVGDNS
jgi:PTH1 family peptidyl-tRNA hydrolase